MKDAAAITAHLVDMRNVGAHKSLKLTLHIPEEHALKAIEAFGWPTGVNPVPVAIARLNLESEVMPAGATNIPDARPRSEQIASGGAKKRWDELSPAQQAGILCNEPAFWKFISELSGKDIRDADQCADYIRFACGVKSRSELNDVSSTWWKSVVSNYRFWQRAPEVIG